MAFDRRSANTTGLTVRSLDCPYIQNLMKKLAWNQRRLNSQG